MASTQRGLYNNASHPGAKNWITTQHVFGVSGILLLLLTTTKNKVKSNQNEKYE
jgi:hypothetical protein